LSSHLVSTLCLRTLSVTLRPCTLSLRFVESPDTEVRCYENGPAEPGGERGAFSSSSRPRPRTPVLPILPVLPGLPPASAPYQLPRRMAGGARRCGAALEPAHGGDAASTSRTPGIDAKRSVRPPRAAHVVRCAGCRNKRISWRFWRLGSLYLFAASRDGVAPPFMC